MLVRAKVTGNGTRVSHGNAPALAALAAALCLVSLMPYGFRPLASGEGAAPEPSLGVSGLRSGPVLSPLAGLGLGWASVQPGEAPGKDNYLVGDAPSRWRTSVPALTYSSYLGGSGVEIAEAIAVDGAGNIYVAGTTGSENFPVVNPIQSNLAGGADVFVSKFDPSGSALIYSTYIGGSNVEALRALAVDEQGNVYVTGRTMSTDYPVVNAYQPTMGGFFDVFVTKLNAGGSALVYSTYLGGSSWDEAFGIAVDAEGNVYITGVTSSEDFPTASPFQPSLRGNADAFVTKLNAAGTALVYSTYLGGTNDFQRLDQGMGITVNPLGEAYVAGITQAPDFPVANPVQPNVAGSFDAFVTKLNAAGSGPVYSTYLGGSGQDEGHGIAVFGEHTFVTGYSFSPNFPTVNPFQPTPGGSFDAFAARISEPQALLVGHVTWQGRPTQPDPLQRLPITLTLKSGTLEVNYPSQVTDAGGFFTVMLGSLPGGTYQWRAKGPTYLANSGVVGFERLNVETLERWDGRTLDALSKDKVNVQTFKRSNVQTAELKVGLMLVGDANNDNAVDVGDFNLLRASFGRGIGDPGFDARADFNGDEVVDSSDFNLLKANFGRSGAPPIGPATLDMPRLVAI